MIQILCDGCGKKLNASEQRSLTVWGVSAKDDVNAYREMCEGCADKVLAYLASLPKGVAS